MTTFVRIAVYEDVTLDYFSHFKYAPITTTDILKDTFQYINA